MDLFEDSFADKVMSRDNSPIPVNLLAKENTSNAAFNISPAKFDFKQALSVSTPMPQRLSHATSRGLSHASRPLSRTFSQRQSPSDESMSPAQKPKVTPSITLTEEERADLLKKKLPDFGFLRIDTLTTKMGIISGAIDQCYMQPSD